MTDLYNTKELVTKILKDKPFTRNSDNFLYFQVITAIEPRVAELSTQAFFLGFNFLDVPGYETVRRTRQKVQEENPDLRASIDIEGHRAINETIFEKFARGE